MNTLGDSGDARAGEGPPVKRPRLDIPPPNVLTREEYFKRLGSVLQPMVKIHAMYNSLVGGIVKDPELMCLPVHDHAIVRGHAVFDTCSVVAGRLYRLDIHLDRHLASAERSRIPLPFGKGCLKECKDQMRTAVAQAVVASGLRDANVRYYTSVGPGNFAVVPQGCTSAFYVVVYGMGGSPMGKVAAPEGIQEFTVSVPMKPAILANTKTNNYLLNCLTAMEAQDRGGFGGILVDDDGCIAESAVMNCIFVTKDRRLITPPFEKILAGTTVRNVLELAKPLVADGTLTAISQESIPVATAKDCVELFVVAGDRGIIPVIGWDGRPVGEGKIGKIYPLIAELMRKDATQGSTDQYELVY